MSVEMKNWDLVAKAAGDVEARVIGQVHATRFGSGFAVHLKNWNYNIVIDKEGHASFDNYGGRWGNIDELKKLQEAYALRAAEKVCQDQGWYCETQNGSLIITHPTGGVITISGTTIDATGFSGEVCAAATAEIEKAMGIESSRTLKPQYGEVMLDQSQVED